MSFVEYVLAVLRSPGAALGRLAADPAAGRLGRQAVLMLGLSWAAFFAVLGLAGHAPSQPPLLPIDVQDYYLFEAGFSIPLYLLMWLALSSTLSLVGRALGGRASGAALRGVAGFSITVPGVVAWLVPDVVVFLWWGLDAIAPAMRYYVPVCVLWTFALTTVGVKRVIGLSTARSVVAALAGAVVYGLVGAPFLR